MPTLHSLIFDWNKTDAPRPGIVLLDDETLRDGLQSPSVRTPVDRRQDPHPASDRSRSASTPPTSASRAPDLTSSATSSGSRARSSTSGCACGRTAPRGRSWPTSGRSRRFRSASACRSRWAPSSGRARCGSTPKGGTLDQLLKLTEDAIAFGVREGLPMMYVTEDTTRARSGNPARSCIRRRSVPARRASASPIPSATRRPTEPRRSSGSWPV